MYLLATFIVFWSLFAIVFGVRESNKVVGDYPQIQKEGILRVCGEEDLFSFYDEYLTDSGFHYNMALAFANRHHLKLIYLKESSLSQRLNMLKNGKCDVLTGPLPVTSSFRKQVNFTKTILESKLVIIQRRTTKKEKNKIIRNQVDFSRKHIYTCENPATVERLLHLAKEISDTIYIRQLIGYDNDRMIAMVAAGLIDYAVCDKHVARSYRKKYPTVDVETPVGFNQIQAWAVKNGKHVLLDSLNVFIAEYKKSPAFTRLIQTYISD